MKDLGNREFELKYFGKSVINFTVAREITNLYGNIIKSYIY